MKDNDTKTHFVSWASKNTLMCRHQLLTGALLPAAYATVNFSSIGELKTKNDTSF